MHRWLDYHMRTNWYFRPEIADEWYVPPFELTERAYDTALFAELSPAAPRPDHLTTNGYTGSARDLAQRPLTGACVDWITQTAVVGHRAGQDGLFRRAYPSAGGLYLVEVYLLAQCVTGWDSGLRHLWIPMLDDAARPGWEILPAPLRGGYDPCWWTGVEDATGIFVLTITPDKGIAKYGERAYRFALLEAGHVCQSLLTTLAAADLACYLVGGFPDTRVSDDMGLTSSREEPVYLVPFG